MNGGGKGGGRGGGKMNGVEWIGRSLVIGLWLYS